jgi:hypothetical protein
MRQSSKLITLITCKIEQELESSIDRVESAEGSQIERYTEKEG